MKTEPQETAASKASPAPERNSALKSSTRPPTRPEAMAVNVRYVGALSRKLDRAPDIQKNCHGSFKSSDTALACRISRAGIIVMKMPRNSAATSAIGWKWKWFAWLTARGVVYHENTAIVSMMLS